MTDKEKSIYNTYLVITRSKLNKPFKIRKDFKDFEKQQHYVHVKRLALFFSRYPHIVPQDFFNAPYEVHPDCAHLPLDYFLTRAAIKTYSIYQKKIQDTSPDNQIDYIRSSYQYIGMFCLKNKLQLSHYLTHKTGCIYSWMLHYREHHISIYSLFELGDVLAALVSSPSDERALLTDNLQQTISKFKVRYHNAVKAKQFCKECASKINLFLQKNLLQNLKIQPEYQHQSTQHNNTTQQHNTK